MNFDDIRPYNNDELPGVLRKIIRDKWLIDGIRTTMMPHSSKSLKSFINFYIRMYLRIRFLGIKTTDEFKRKISLGVVIKDLIKNTTSNITYTGLDYLDPDKRYVFISNHRDIVLDPALLVNVLSKNGFKIPYIAFGDNLILKDIVGDLIRINSGFIVKRNLTIREQVKESKRLSAFINSILDSNNSIWVAQREGRAKDGIDTTNPAVIKMVYLAQRKEMSLSDFIRKLSIVPVSISYEFDPTDELKGWALYRKRTYGNHLKRRFEDLIHITRGMKGFKGNVNLSFSRPLEGEFNSVQEVAEAIDTKIQTGYKLWTTNYIAYDTFKKTDKYSNRYNKAEAQKFLKRYKKLPEYVRNIILESYANPVLSFEKQIQ